MGIVFLILEYLLITLLFLLIIILFIPVVYSLDGIKNEYSFFSFRLSWPGKILSILIKKEENQTLDTCIVIFGFRISINNIGKKKQRVKIKDKEKQKILKKVNTKYLSIVHQSFLTQLFIFLRRLFRHILPRKFRFHLIYGFEDAADTGMLSGFIAILLPYILNDDIVLRPAFLEILFEKLKRLFYFKNNYWKRDSSRGHYLDTGY